MIKWAKLKFPPINLWTVWPSPEMLKLVKEPKLKNNEQTNSNYYRFTSH